MPAEVEIKLRCTDLAAVRQRLEAAGAHHSGTVREENTLFDTAGGQLRAGDCGLRLRTVTGDTAGAWLTYKGPRAAGPLKRREELETGLTDPAAVAALLERLGYTPVVIYEKRRETWQFDPCSIELDELPKLGTFVEIEGPDEHTIANVRRRLELDGAAEESATYVELAANHGTHEPSGAVALRF